MLVFFRCVDSLRAEEGKKQHKKKFILHLLLNECPGLQLAIQGTEADLCNKGVRIHFIREEIEKFSAYVVQFEIHLWSGNS